MKIGVTAALVAVMVGCAHAPPAPPAFGGFKTDEARVTACLDLRDHIVDLYAESYIQGQAEGAFWTPAERLAFRDGWAEELAKKGTFDRFETYCFASVTQSKFECAMGAASPDGMTACMQLGRTK